MADDREGICETCVPKPRGDGEAPAALCGHLARPDGARFCVTCAAKHGVCRICGMRFTAPHAEHDP